ncbi:MAG: hypothetical protein M3259_07535 [Actinomycetota bacterium]|nr:hypothetical protein [Actinomycetota bacterium]
MRGPGRLVYAGIGQRMGPYARHEPPVPLALGLLVGGVVFLFATAALFSGFFPFVLFFWMLPFFLVPAFGVAARGMAGLLAAQPRRVSEGDKEKVLLKALARHGEITATRAALETTLSVSEADRMLSELAQSGDIEVRAQEGRLGYALWDHDRSELTASSRQLQQ